MSRVRVSERERMGSGGKEGDQVGEVGEVGEGTSREDEDDGEDGGQEETRGRPSRIGGKVKDGAKESRGATASAPNCEKWTS